MQTNSDADQKAWQRIEELFKLREDLHDNAAELNTTLHTVKIEEVDSILYKALAPQVNRILRGVALARWTADGQEELVNEAIHRLLQAYSGFQGKSSLRTYCTTIIKNVASRYLKKQHREKSILPTEEEEMTRLTDQKALDEFTDPQPAARAEAMAAAEHVLEELDFNQVRLTDKEFVAVVIKLASQCLMRKKIPDEELAGKLGMKRTTFTDSYARGRTKICRYLKEKGKYGE